MSEKTCPAVIASGKRKGQRCDRIAWKPNQYGFYCRYHYRLYENSPSVSMLPSQKLKTIHTDVIENGIDTNRQRETCSETTENCDNVYEKLFLLRAREIYYHMKPINEWLKKYHCDEFYNWETLSWEKNTILNKY